MLMSTRALSHFHAGSDLFASLSSTTRLLRQGGGRLQAWRRSTAPSSSTFSADWPRIGSASFCNGTRRRTVGCAAYASQDGVELIQVAVSPYKILGLSKLATQDSVLRAYDELVVRPPDMNLSTDLMCSRAVVLKAAADTLADGLARRGFEKTGMLTIPAMDLPGTIAILVEIGDSDAAIQWGLAWLDQNETDPCRSDVAILVASAYCDAAGALVDKSLAHSLEGYQMLHRAKSLMERYHTGSELLTDIVESIEVLAPKAALLMIASGKPALCREGLSLMKHVLWSNGRPVLEFPFLKLTRAQFIAEALICLAPSQQIQLFETDTKEGTRTTRCQLTRGEVYDLAMAYLADGIQSCSVARVKQALAQFQSLHNRSASDQTSARQSTEGGVTMEVTICNLLLGKVHAAEQVLGLTKDNGTTPDPAILQFVQMHSGADSRDYLTGLYVLAQQWLDDVLSQKFPTLTMQTILEPSLQMDSWFGNPNVKWTLQLEEKSNQFGIAPIISRVSRTYLALIEALARMLSQILLLLKPGQMPSGTSSNPLKASSPRSEDNDGGLQVQSAIPTGPGGETAQTHTQPVARPRPRKETKRQTANTVANNIQPMPSHMGGCRAAYDDYQGEEAISTPDYDQILHASGEQRLDTALSASPSYAMTSDSKAYVPAAERANVSYTGNGYGSRSPAPLSADDRQPTSRLSTVTRQPSVPFSDQSYSPEISQASPHFVDQHGKQASMGNSIATDYPTLASQQRAPAQETYQARSSVQTSSVALGNPGFEEADAEFGSSQENADELPFSELTAGTIGSMQQLAKDAKEKEEVNYFEGNESELDLGPPQVDDSSSRKRFRLSQGYSPPRLLSLQSESDMWQSPDTVDPRTRAIARLILLALMLVGLSFVAKQIWTHKIAQGAVASLTEILQDLPAVISDFAHKQKSNGLKAKSVLLRKMAAA